MHGNEMLGIDLVKRIQDKPIKGVDAVIANEEAVRKGTRFVRNDLNRSFPGTSNSTDYELRRARQLVKLCKKYDIVLDFHNTTCSDNNCSFVGAEAQAKLFNLSSQFDLNRVIVADYDCLNKYTPNCLSVEISVGSSRDDSGLWYDKIKQLSDRGLAVGESGVEKYRFIYRITLEDRDRLALRTRSLKAFQVIDSDLAIAMGVKSPAYPIFIDDEFTPYNYGGLLDKFDS